MLRVDMSICNIKLVRAYTITWIGGLDWTGLDWTASTVSFNHGHR